MSNTGNKTGAASKKAKLPPAAKGAEETVEQAETKAEAAGEEISPTEGVSMETEQKSPQTFAMAAEEANLPSPRGTAAVAEPSFLAKRTQDGMWKVVRSDGGGIPKILEGSYTHHMYAQAAIAKYKADLEQKKAAEEAVLKAS